LVCTKIFFLSSVVELSRRTEVDFDGRHGSDVSIRVERAWSTVQQLRRVSRDAVALLCRSAVPHDDVIRRLPASATAVAAVLRTSSASPTFDVVDIRRCILAVGDVIATG